MNGIVRLAAVSLLLTAFSATLRAQDYHQYEINGREGCVYYGNVLVRGADLLTFEDLGFGYAKDIYHVYRHGVVLEYVDPDYFRVSSEFAADEGGDMSGYNAVPDFGGQSDDGLHISIKGGK